MKKLIYVVLVVFLSMTTSGCTTSRAVGKRLVELEKPVDKIDVIVHWVGFAGSQVDYMGSIAASEANDVLKDFIPHLPVRAKEVFAANGIEGRLQIWSGPQLPANMDFADANEFPYLLLITPRSSSYEANSGCITITMTAILLDRGTKKNLWEGELGFSKSSLATIDDKAVDDFLMAILGQLSKDGMVSLKNGVPVAPEELKKAASNRKTGTESKLIGAASQ